jgi:integrase
VRVRLRGINTTTKTLGDGTKKTYRYHRATGIALDGEPDTADFVASYAAAEATMRDKRKGVFSQLSSEYTSSEEFKTLLGESTQASYKRMLGKAEEEFGDLPISALNDPRVKGEFLDWRDRIAKSSGKREADHRLSAVSACLTWAADRTKIDANYLRGFTRLYHQDRSEIIWLPEHIEAFMNVAEVEMQRALILGLHLGQREGDLLKLPWSAYDGEAIRLRRRKSRRKGIDAPVGEIRCTRPLRQMLDSMDRLSPLILTTKTGRAFKKRYFCRLWAETMVKAGIETVQLPDFDKPVRLHFNDLRGTSVTLLAEAGCTVPEIASITGHSLETVTTILKRYLKFTKGLADRAMSKFERSKNSKFAMGLRVSGKKAVTR